MKKFSAVTLAVIVVVGAALLLFREPLFDALGELITADMFVAADEDDFDPGVGVGEPVPEIAARHQGRAVTGVAEFLGPNGLVLMAVRSVDW